MSQFNRCRNAKDAGHTKRISGNRATATVNRCGRVNKIRGDAREIPLLASIRLISGAVSSPGHAIPIYTVVEKGRISRKKRNVEKEGI